jgi:hypothetical protein
MTLPITLKNQSDFDAPRNNRKPTVAKFVNVCPICGAAGVAGSKKGKHLPTF